MASNHNFRTENKRLGLSLVMMIALLLSACQPAAELPAAEPTVIFRGNECSYSGPDSIKVGTVNFTLDVQDKKFETYSFVLVRLFEGKTIADLEDWKSTDAPSWLTLVIGKKTSDPGKVTYPVEIKRGPLYLVCFSEPPEQKIGQFGPIEVLE